MVSFSRRCFLRAASSCITRAVRLAVAESLMPLEGRGVDVPDLGFADESIS